ncbi:P-loop containing nucleoside triphosphate hydrolase protein [Mycena capillaripes]|nr:P-loop containing nucleoside triphosphate hydrolase protein [Mycena capillaripes]
MSDSFLANARLIDPRDTKRTVRMEVLVLGFPRTGSTSMHDALKILGYRDVHHMQSVFKNPKEADMWIEAVYARFHGRGTPYGRAEWDQLLGNCAAVTDCPSVVFAEDLIAAYPDAKVVLTSRDLDKWWKSYTDTIRPMMDSRVFRFAAFLDPSGLGQFYKMASLHSDILLGPAYTEESAKKRFEEHYAAMRRAVPKERLLEYDVKEGWGPLCAFLGKEVPSEKFSHTNDTKMMNERIAATTTQVFQHVALRTPLPVILLTGVAIAIYARCTRVE